MLSQSQSLVEPQTSMGAALDLLTDAQNQMQSDLLAKKVAAGADFIQTQYCFDIPRLKQFMSAVRQAGMHEQVYILVGVGPLRSAGAARWMRGNVPGVVIPDEVISRLEGVEKGKQQAEGKKICVEIIQQVREIEGVAGVHVMAYRQEELVAEIVHEAGLFPRPRRHGASDPANRARPKMRKTST